MPRPYVRRIKPTPAPASVLDLAGSDAEPEDAKELRKNLDEARHQIEVLERRLRLADDLVNSMTLLARMYRN